MIKLYFGAKDAGLQAGGASRIAARTTARSPTIREPCRKQPHAFRLDDRHLFKTGMPLLVCSNTAAMLAGTRYGGCFHVIGDRSRHFGRFNCAPAVPIAMAGSCC